jgi:hypothetical protein
VEAAKWLADRGFGKATQTVEIEVAPQPAIDFTGYTTEDLRTLIGIMDKYAPDTATDR